ncbi:hypothetical protein QUB52_01445 [Microcoleus sp. A6-C6]
MTLDSGQWIFSEQSPALSTINCQLSADIMQKCDRNHSRIA